MINKKFTNLQTDQVVTINEVFSDIAILDNGDRVSLQRITDNNYYEEYIDPASFFSNSNSFNVLADKIKSIPDELLQQLPERESPMINNYNVSQESAVIQSDPEEEKRALMEKARQMSAETVVSSLQKQNEMFSEFLDDDDSGIVLSRPTPVEVSPAQPNFNNNTPIQQPIYNTPEPTRIHVEDPIITMFRGVKRKEKFSVDIKIEELIPRLDFIEMLEDSYEISIIDFLSEEFTKKLLDNPDFIKNIIKQEIKKVVYGENIKSEKSTVRKTPVRRPKPNTAIGEKPNATSPRKKQTQKND